MLASCGCQGYKITAHSVFWLEVVKGIPNQDVVFCIGWFLCLFVMPRTYAVFCFLVFGCQYQYN